MKELTVGPNDAGQRLDRFLAKAVPLLPGALLQKDIRLKRIKVNGARTERNVRLAVGDKVQLYVSDEFFTGRSETPDYLAASPDVNVIYEDKNILLADKKPGMLCHPDSEGASGRNTLIARIQAYLYKNGEWDPKAENAFAPALCNRIDRNTGGIVIAAKNAAALRILDEKIRQREIEKSYLCVVCGAPRPPKGTLKSALFKDAAKNQVFVEKDGTPGARTAVTEYRTLASKGGLSLVECRLVTGRTHQIRVQMADAGFPLLGDGKYGREKTNRAFGKSGQQLWAYRLGFRFKTGAGELSYLDGKTFFSPDVPFVREYFPEYRITK